MHKSDYVIVSTFSKQVYITNFVNISIFWVRYIFMYMQNCARHMECAIGKTTTFLI